ncbi:MAG TPA: VOC family protein [Gemmatimonadales bacterium]|nr:VOC family protein [Gemmatimonadales bacterium]
MSQPALIGRLTPVLFVDRIGPCLPFWTERLGFEVTAQVPGPDGEAQFVILARDGIEVMYQTWAATAAESQALVAAPRGHSVALFVEVADIERIDRALAGIHREVERHRTFYGMDELSVREPGGAVVTFAMRVADGS